MESFLSSLLSAKEFPRINQNERDCIQVTNVRRGKHTEAIKA